MSVATINQPRYNFTGPCELGIWCWRRRRRRRLQARVPVRPEMLPEEPATPEGLQAHARPGQASETSGQEASQEEADGGRQRRWRRRRQLRRLVHRRRGVGAGLDAGRERRRRMASYAGRFRLNIFYFFGDKNLSVINLKVPLSQLNC